jgi:sensor histidine kinase regulating citrate/malate metabolism
MKKIALFSTIIVMGLLTGLAAQDLNASATPVATTRQVNQASRIAHGTATGQLIRPERKALKAEQRHIRRVKRRAKADGVVTGEEKLRINRKQRRADRHIRRQKHDAQNRY